VDLYEKSLVDRISHKDLISILSCQDEVKLDSIFKNAYQVKSHFVGRKVFLRGLVECSNICALDCYYCGIRKSIKSVPRYRMSSKEVVQGAVESWKNNYGSVVIQGGEISSPEFSDYIENILKEIRQVTGGELGITLSLGEQSEETYARWREAGAHRYLLRIESSNPELFASLHPPKQQFDTRLEALALLKKTGYQVGTGVLIGVPGQTVEDLAGDLEFFREIDVDMIGMGPFIPHALTPMKDAIPDFEQRKEEQLLLGVKMIAAARLLLRDVNIASTTALETLSSDGRNRGLLAGANVVMPNVTDPGYKVSYTLYDGKPGTGQTSDEGRINLEKSIASIGESIGYGEWGDSRHYFNRISAADNC
jgi:biotin synthase